MTTITTTSNKIADIFQYLIETPDERYDIEYVAKNIADSEIHQKYAKIHAFILANKKNIVKMFQKYVPVQIRTETAQTISLYCQELGQHNPLFSRCCGYHVILYPDYNDNIEKRDIIVNKTIEITPEMSFDEWMSHSGSNKKYWDLVGKLLFEAD
jgi:hypothetical protein